MDEHRNEEMGQPMEIDQEGRSLPSNGERLLKKFKITITESCISDDFHHDQEVMRTTNFSLEEPVTIKLVYVADPTRYATKSAAENDVSWIKAVLSEEEINKMEDLSSLSFHVTSRTRKSKNPNSFNVIIQEWVSEPDVSI